mmetsp:Transcript_10752/g.39479  ORF Transcript_10752/g.39479 Transcript_10752/m.39479 type:complete len:431 (-) Transcript_10752:1845-3137(-)|eukprot:scaffold1558_cov403-Prasinococcus_capsulatus_cf.AAC.10
MVLTYGSPAQQQYELWQRQQQERRLQQQQPPPQQQSQQQTQHPLQKPPQQQRGPQPSKSAEGAAGSSAKSPTAGNAGGAPGATVREAVILARKSKQAIKEDVGKVSTVDIASPFESVTDACNRLLPFHIFHEVTDEELDRDDRARHELLVEAGEVDADSNPPSRVAAQEREQTDKAFRLLSSYKEQFRRLQSISQKERATRIPLDEEFLVERLLLQDCKEWKERHNKRKKEDEEAAEAEAKKLKSAATPKSTVMEVHTPIKFNLSAMKAPLKPVKTTAATTGQSVPAKPAAVFQTPEAASATQANPSGASSRVAAFTQVKKGTSAKPIGINVFEQAGRPTGTDPAAGKNVEQATQSNTATASPATGTIPLPVNVLANAAKSSGPKPSTPLSGNIFDQATKPRTTGPAAKPMGGNVFDLAGRPSDPPQAND